MFGMSSMWFTAKQLIRANLVRDDDPNKTRNAFIRNLFSRSIPLSACAKKKIITFEHLSVLCAVTLALYYPKRPEFRGELDRTVKRYWLVNIAPKIATINYVELNKDCVILESTMQNALVAKMYVFSFLLSISFVVFFFCLLLKYLVLSLDVFFDVSLFI